MRKFTAIFLVLVLVFGMFGCSNGKNQNKKPDFSVSDLLLFKAGEIVRQIGMRAEKDYLTALDLPTDVASVVGVFEQAVTADPVNAKVQTGVLKSLPQDITQMCSHFAGANKLAGCSALVFSDQIFMAAKLEAPTAVYLRYSDECHFIVVFTPLGDNLASVWGYPLYAEVAEKVLKTYFSGAQELDAKQIQTACKAGSKGIFQAQCTDQKTNVGYYTQLVTTIFKQAKPLSPQQIRAYTTDQKIVAQVTTLSQHMSNGVQALQVYHFPSRMEAQVDKILEHSSYSQELRAYTRQQLYLSFPQQLCARYGEDWAVVSSILSSAVKTDHMSATASAKEEPVLVLVNLRGGTCLLVSVYPGPHQTYLYRYAAIPVPYPEAINMLSGMGATKMK